MKLSKALLGAILIGVTVQTTGCSKKDKETPQPSVKETTNNTGEVKLPPYNCPACGMG